jgi:hypothetical protein
MRVFRPAILSLLPLFALPVVLPGDAIVRTQAMLAGTSAELFIEEGRL